MSKNYIKKRKILKKAIFTVCIIAVILAGIFFAGRHVIVNFIFDRYIMEPAVQIMKDADLSEYISGNETPAPTATPEAEATPAASSAPGSVPDSDSAPAASAPAKRSLTVSEIAYKVLERPDLMAQLEGMVSSADKSAVLSIGKSCFTREEKKYYIAEIAKNGFTGTIKSEMMAIVQSRMTADKKSEIISRFAKYAESFRPYFE